MVVGSDLALGGDGYDDMERRLRSYELAQIERFSTRNQELYWTQDLQRVIAVLLHHREQIQRYGEKVKQTHVDLLFTKLNTV